MSQYLGLLSGTLLRRGGLQRGFLFEQSRRRAARQGIASGYPGCHFVYVVANGGVVVLGQLHVCTALGHLLHTVPDANVHIGACPRRGQLHVMTAHR